MSKEKLAKLTIAWHSGKNEDFSSMHASPGMSTTATQRWGRIGVVKWHHEDKMLDITQSIKARGKTSMLE